MDAYEIYVEKYGLMRSGHKLTSADYGEYGLDGVDPYPLEGKLAVSVASQDHASKHPLRTRSEFEEELKRLLASEVA